MEGPTYIRCAAFNKHDVKRGDPVRLFAFLISVCFDFVALKASPFEWPPRPSPASLSGEHVPNLLFNFCTLHACISFVGWAALKASLFE